MVKAFVLQPILQPWPGSPVEEFHLVMFHGEQDPDSPTYRRWKTPFLGDKARPLYLMRSGSRIPEVFEVNLNLIVSSAVKEALTPLPSVAFVPVVFSKLIDMPYRAGTSPTVTGTRTRLSRVRSDRRTSWTSIPTTGGSTELCRTSLKFSCPN
jgi:hypothetical protein